MHSSQFFRVKPIARLIFKAQNFPEAIRFPLIPTIILNDRHLIFVLVPIIFCYTLDLLLQYLPFANGAGGVGIF